MKHENHHVVPISLWGVDKVSNYMRLSHERHKHLHNVLNISSIEHSKLNREWKKMTNGQLIKRPQEIEYIWEYQKKFFMNLDKLPPRLIKKHIPVFMELVGEAMDQYKTITWDDFDKPTRHKWSVYLVHWLHDHLLEIQKESAKSLLQTIKSIYIPTG